MDGFDVAEELIEAIAVGDHQGQAVRAVVVIVMRMTQDGLARHLVTLVGARVVDDGKRTELAVGRAGIGVHADLAVDLRDAAGGLEVTLARDIADDMALRCEGFDIAQVDRVCVGERLALHAVVRDALHFLVERRQSHIFPLFLLSLLASLLVSLLFLPHALEGVRSNVLKRLREHWLL